jgi:hypothetical protein
MAEAIHSGIAELARFAWRLHDDLSEGSNCLARIHSPGFVGPACALTFCNTSSEVLTPTNTPTSNSAKDRVPNQLCFSAISLRVASLTRYPYSIDFMPAPNAPRIA